MTRIASSDTRVRHVIDAAERERQLLATSPYSGAGEDVTLTGRRRLVCLPTDEETASVLALVLGVGRAALR